MNPFDESETEAIFRFMDEHPDIRDVLYQKFPDIAEGIILFVGVYYNKNSLLISKIKETEKRKKYILGKITASYKKAVSDKLFRLLINVEDNDILNVIILYCISQHSRLWSLIVTNEKVFNEYTGLLFKPIILTEDFDVLKEADLKGKLMRGLDEINNRLVRYYAFMFPVKEEDKALKEMIDKITPEIIAANGL